MSINRKLYVLFCPFCKDEGNKSPLEQASLIPLKLAMRPSISATYTGFGISIKKNTTSNIEVVILSHCLYCKRTVKTIEKIPIGSQIFPLLFE